MSLAAFLEARDFLLRERTRYETARQGFRWPELTAFNWALDYFDAHLARGPRAHQPALILRGTEEATLTFAELAERSNRLANGLRGLGVKRGDRLLLMLGNTPLLWETMLAAMKLGAVVVPATTLLTPADLADRFSRGRVRFLVAEPALAGKFEGLDPKVVRITWPDGEGRVPEGWVST
jgi:acetyl-CoA synthetase